MPANVRTVKDLFAAAVELVDADERRDFLDRECGSDADLRRRLDALLHAHDHPDSALSRPFAVGRTGAYEPGRGEPAETPGTVVAGRYKLLERIGEGGMGDVWVADQHEPIRRRVALKLIKPGMDSRSVLARFEAERQALALMDHPHIAKVLDAGAMADGRPYFVMELVKGTPITQFADARKLTTRERLELFVPVCQAIQHAHQKGVIHRDIKPSNVLVELHDEKPVPKVIDFGVAKAVGQQLTEKTLYTGFGSLIGTPTYMAPEQATFNALDVDTRADVYALGVLLYELLAGSPPFEPERLKEAALDEVLRLVREEEPPRPSARLSTSRTKASIAAVRQSDPEKLTKLVRGELDWIVMKALEKDRGRRYETATGFAADVQRYLAGESVLAVPPSAGYRVRKFVRRNKAQVLTAGALAGVLLLGAILTGIGFVRANMERERALHALVSEERARQQADAARNVALVARDEAEAARQDADRKAHEIQAGAEQMSAAGAAMDLGEARAMARQWADADKAHTRATELRPEQSQVWQRRALLYGKMGLYDLAVADYARAFDRREPDTVFAWHRYALARLEQGDADGYRRLCARMLGKFADASDAPTRFTLARCCALAPGAAAADDRLLRLVEEPRGRSETTHHWVRLFVRGLTMLRAGRPGEAVPCLRESLTRTDYHARALNYPVLALALHAAGQADAARQELENSRAELERWSQHAFNLTDHLSPWEYWNDWMEFQFLHREAHRLIEGSPLPADPRLVTVRGRALAALGRDDDAAAEYARAALLAPGNAAVRFKSFEFAANRKRWPQAEAELAAILQFNAADPHLHMRAFRAFAANGRWDRAAAEHATAMRLKPNDVPIRLERFRFHAERGEASEAEAAYAAATKDRPDDIPFRIACADACAGFKQWAKARQEYARILDADILGDGELNRDAWLALAVLQLYFGDVDAYRKTCFRLVERHGRNTDPRLTEMLVRLCNLDPDPGVEPARLNELVERHARELTNRDTSLHIAALASARVRADDATLPALAQGLNRFAWTTQRAAIALVHHERGHYDKARLALSRVAADDRKLDLTARPAGRWTTNVEAQLWYRRVEAVVQSERWRTVESLVQGQEYAAAIRRLDDLLKPGHPYAPDWLGRSYCHAQLGHWPEATADSVQALALDPDNWRAAHGSALLALHRGDRDAYRACCRQALERRAESNDRFLLNQAAWLCILDPAAEAEAGRALPLVEKAMGIASIRMSRDLARTHGCVLYRVGRYDEARKQLTDLLAQPGYEALPPDWLFLAMAHHRLGQTEPARKYLAQANAWFAVNKPREWYLRLELDRYRAEAEALVGATPPAPTAGGP